MEQEYKYGEVCSVKQDITSYKKLPNKTAHILIPAGSPVTIVSVSANMAIVRYRDESFPTRIDNLLKKL